MGTTRFHIFNRARERVTFERRWIAEHGGDIAGYFLRYGEDGDGYEAIYAADLEALRRAEAELERLGGRC